MKKKLHSFKIQDGGQPPFVKLLNSQYVSEKLSDFDETWYTASDVEPHDSHMAKN